LQTLLAAITLGWLFVAINGVSIAAAVSQFDPSSLIRYPLRFGRYFVLRTLIGFMTVSTVVGCLSLLAAAIGISIAKRPLAVPALAVLAIYALMNVFFTRMIGAWMERWLANRRFREIFSVLMALSVLSLQFMGYQRYSPRVPGGYPPQVSSVPRSWLFNFVETSHSAVHWLPPGFAADAILNARHLNAALAPFAALLASTLLFAVAFAVRLRKQFLGEYFSDSVMVRRKGKLGAGGKAGPKTFSQPEPAAPEPKSTRAGLPPVVAACLRKEWLLFRGNTAQIIGLITPLVFVAILIRGQLAMHPALFLPTAVAYVLLGSLASLYNIFGADGLGVQIYFMTPIRMRDVILAKNISGLTLTVTQATLAWTLVWFLKRAPIPFATQVSTVLWTIFVIAVNVTIGAIRSVQAPRRFVPGQARQQRGTPTNRTSGLLILLVLFGSLLLQAPVIWLCRHLHQPWLAAWIFGPLAVTAIAAYALLLRNAEHLVLSHREALAEELCKA
jgi:ABC-2 type transport system permease protein